MKYQEYRLPNCSIKETRRFLKMVDEVKSGKRKTTGFWNIARHFVFAFICTLIGG